MSENEIREDAPEARKKVSLQEAVKQKLAQKKQQQSGGNRQVGGPAPSTQAMKSQLTKKPNNQHRRTGV